MNSQNRKWLKVTAATFGAAALTLGGVALPAAAVDSSPEAADAAQLNVESNKYEAAAAQLRVSAAEVEQLEQAGEINVSENGFVYFVDKAHDHFGAELAQLNLPEAQSAAIPGDSSTGSRPGAPVTVYLDFTGTTLEGTQWNFQTETESLEFPGASGVTAAGQELVWAAVAEDYAPFNVNVTLQDPGADALYKTSPDDNVYGSHVIITDFNDSDLLPVEGAGGVAWLSGLGSDYLTGALVFTDGMTDDNAKTIAEIATHESGHNFGLAHHGHEDGEGAIGEGDPYGYYVPTAGLWGPIMGAAYSVPVSQWTDGSYGGANNTSQADLSVMTDRSAADNIFLDLVYADGTSYPADGPVCSYNGSDLEDPQPGDQFQVPNADNLCDGSGEILDTVWTFIDRADFAADDHGNDSGSATDLDNADGTFEITGVVETNTDIDVFELATEGGEITAEVAVANVSPNLNAKLTLTDSSGSEIDADEGAPSRESGSQASGLGAEITATVEAGTYYLSVEGVGFGDPSDATADDAGGFSDYGSLGNYTLSGEAAPSEDPELDAPVIEVPADGSTTDDTTPAVSGTGAPGATVTVLLDGTDAGTAVVDAEGNWTLDLAELEEGTYTLTATQELDGVTSDASEAVSFNVEIEDVDPVLDAPVIESPANETTTDDNTPVVSGTGAPGATVTVTVTADIQVTAVVDADGNWSVELPELADGTYTITATQTLDGVTSAASVPVTLTVATGSGDDDGDGNNEDDDEIADTGASLAGTYGLLGAGVLLLTAGIALYGFRQRKTLLDS